MDLIPSFSVDHNKIYPGIYKSRIDNDITTYDIRMKRPNAEPCISPSALHTIEHIIATYLRNNKEWKDKLIYWGPMGCLTGNYMIVRGEYDCHIIRDIMIEAFTYLVNFEGEIPGTDKTQCGNYLMHNLEMAKWESLRFIDNLKNHFVCDYPAIERQNTKEGKQFYDS